MADKTGTTKPKDKKPAARAAAKKGAAKATTKKPAPKKPADPRQGKAVAEPKPKKPQVDESLVSTQVKRLADDVVHLATLEAKGEQGRNAARFQRGALMLSLRDTARAMKVRQKDLLAEVNARALEMAERNNLLSFQPVSSVEATTTAKVVERFGVGGDYPLVGAINKLTGEPLVGDDGNPLRIDLTSVALNKLYALADIDEAYIDEAVSFAFRHTEKVVRKAKKVASDTKTPLAEVIAAVNQARVTAPHPVTGAPIQVQPEGVDALKVLSDMAGEAPESEVVSIKTTRALYDGFFVPLKKLMSAVAERFNPSLVAASQDGMVSNAFVIEHTIVQFFNVHEDEGVQRALAAMVAADLITPKQADEFVDTFAVDPVTDTWSKVRDLPSEVAEVAAVLDEVPGDEPEDDWGDDDPWDEDEDEDEWE